MPLRFALDLTHHPWTTAADPAATAQRTVDLARAADEGGIDAIWVSEDPEGWDAFALLGALATVTRRAQLGTGVVNPYPRHPNLLAASIATLDRLSGGRAILGLGRGQPEWSAGSLGIEIGSPLAALETTIRLLHDWWTAPHRASTDERDAASPFRIADWDRTVHPLGRPPIVLAAAGPKALALAGRLADGVVFNALTSDQFLAEAIPTVHAAARAAGRAAGRDPAALAVILRTAVHVTANPEPFLERQKNLIALVNALPGMDRLLRVDGFDVPSIMADVRAVMATERVLAAGGGFPAIRRAGDLVAARAAIPTTLVARLAIAGPADHVRARLRDLAALGVSHVSVAPPTDPSAAAFADLLATIRLEVSG